jgi:hypothetical protein
MIAMSWLTGCAMGSSDVGDAAVCPPVVEYSRPEQVQAAAELALLPQNAVIVGMMSDYTVMREQARACGAQ